MNRQSGKSVLIFFVAIGWLSLVSYIYLHEKRAAANTHNGYDIGVLAYEDKEETLNQPGDDFFTIDSQPQELYVSNSQTDNIATDPEIILEENSSTEKAVPENSQNNHAEIPKQVILDSREDTLELQQDTEIELRDMSSQDFLDTYDSFENSQNLQIRNKYIYNIPAVDIYITAKAMIRGYQQRGFGDESEMVWFENVRIRPEVRDAYKALRNEMQEENIRLHFVSGYRSSTSQRSIFKNKLNLVRPEGIPDGSYDAFLDSVLAVSSIPGYSKHHSGYAVDFGCGNDYLVYSFAETECYEYLSKDNFKNARRHGFIPSYPEGVSNQGPNPEPWEFVWVGEMAQ
ncbi:hypothetical protein CL684_02105 [Candidatus Campbellbacteria bacterium]|nr:hypothetical protein [Candidatus Campbellbacteria bacterium]|tara:strand:+ start:4278 stop:5306 length:1029 start_codon:yes stop_codon:yes gene_type:complete